MTFTISGRRCCNGLNPRSELSIRCATLSRRSDTDSEKGSTRFTVGGGDDFLLLVIVQSIYIIRLCVSYF